MRFTTWQMGLAVTASLAILASTTTAWGADAGGDHRIGVGANYWRTIDNIDDDSFDEDGISWIGTYQYWPGLVGLELDVEWFREGFGGSPEDVYAPQALVLVGRWVYAAGGIGGYYSDGDFAEDPFYVFRAGLNFQALPALYLDLNANYRFEAWDDLEASETNIDSDTVTLGAAARFAF